MRRWILRMTAFCAAAASVTGGLAMASMTQPPEVAPSAAVPAPVAPAPTSEVAGRDRDHDHGHDHGHDHALTPEGRVGEAKAAVAWPARIDARMSALRPTRVALAPDAIVHARPDRSLAGDLAPLLATTGKRLSVHVRDLDNGRVLVDEQGDRGLNPASNHKILTSLAALELLGADYRFETKLAVQDDTLYVIGEGDPSLLLDDVHDMVADLIAAGYGEHVQHIVVDDSAFSDRRFGPGYDAGGTGESYMAPSGALSVNFNTVEVITHPDLDGSPTVDLFPESTMAEVHAQVRVGHTRLDVRTDAGDGRTAPLGATVVHVRGRLPSVHAPVTERRRVSDPGLFAAGVFANDLANQLGNAPVSIERGLAPDEADIVVRHRSAPLHEVLTSAMKYSNNFTTEQVLRTLAWRATDHAGDWSEGVDVVSSYWHAVGNDPDAFEFINGSGLNRHGRATTRALVELVTRAASLDGDARALDAIMARSGGEGTLHHRLGGLRGRVRAKTGTMAGVSALSGTVVSRDGDKRLAFSIVVNGGDVTKARALQDDIVAALAAYADRRG